MAERDFKGVWIPAEIWLNKELSIMEKLFLVEIDSLDNKFGCVASNAHFSEFFGITKARCTQIIKSLEAKKLVTIALKRNGKQITERKIRVVNKLTRGSKNTKLGYLENAQGSNTKDNNTKPRAFCPKSSILPDSINQPAWFEWCDYRSSIKAKISKHAFAKQVKLLAAYPHDVQQEMIDKSISNDWKGVFKPDETRNGAFDSPADRVRKANRPIEAVF
jgi:hypothetical protein